MMIYVKGKWVSCQPQSAHVRTLHVGYHLMLSLSIHACELVIAHCSLISLVHG